jgi:hypothetical protein
MAGIYARGTAKALFAERDRGAQPGDYLRASRFVDNPRPADFGPPKFATGGLDHGARSQNLAPPTGFGCRRSGRNRACDA